MQTLPTRDREATRERLLREAITAFSRDGYAAVTTRAVALGAGVNIATLHYHFGNKEGLYRAAVDAVYERLRARTVDLLPLLPKLSIAEAMLHLVRAARQEREAVLLLLREVLDHGGLTEGTSAAHYLPYVEEASRWLAAHQGVDEERARRAVVAVSFLLSRFAIQNEASLRSAFGTDTPINTLIADLLSTTLEAQLRSPS